MISVFGIVSIVFGAMALLCMGSAVAFFAIAVSVICAFIGLADPEKPKWMSTLGASLSGVALLLCCCNILIKAGPTGFLLHEDEFIASMREAETAAAEYAEYDTGYDDYYTQDPFSEESEFSDESESLNDGSGLMDDPGSAAGNSLWGLSDPDISETSGMIDQSRLSGMLGEPVGGPDQMNADEYGNDDYSDENAMFADDVMTDDMEFDESLIPDGAYLIGDTWSVPGQWTLTITDVEETDYRNEYSGISTDAVYYIHYYYENLGYSDPSGMADGLYLDIESATILDSTGSSGMNYPGDVNDFPADTPIGSYTEAVGCICLDHRGDFTLEMNVSDMYGDVQSAVFYIRTGR